MKSLFKIIILLIVATNLNSYSQNESPSLVTAEIRSDSNIVSTNNAFTFGFSNISGTTNTMNSLTVAYEVFVSENVSLSYSLGLNLSNRHGGFHTTLGLAGLYYALESIGKSESESKSYCRDNYRYGSDDYYECLEDRESSQYAFAALLAIVPEGINVYINKGSIFSVVTYFDLLGFEFSDKGSQITSNLGVKFGIKLGNNVYVEPKLGLKINVSDGGSGFVWGIGIKSHF